MYMQQKKVTECLLVIPFKVQMCNYRFIRVSGEVPAALADVA